MQIIPGDLSDPRVIALLDVHVASALAVTPRESAHALDATGLKSPDMDFWTMWEGDILVGTGALKRLSPDHGEVKSMHVVQSMRRRGAGSLMLRHIIAEAGTAGMSRLSLETGAMEYFRPARALYIRHGFVECPAFGDYAPDPNSIFMTLELRN